MGTTLGSGSGLDQDKTLACRTLGTPPRRPLEPLGCRRDLRKTKDDAKDDCHVRRHTPQCSTTAPPRFGEKTTTSTIPCACTPSLLVSIKGGGGLSLKGVGPFSRTQRSALLTEHICSSEPRYWHSPQSTPPLAETWELSSLSRLACTPYYMHLGAR